MKLAGQRGRAATQALARQAAVAGVQALVVVGGDGTLADVAFALIGMAQRPPILGIGAGSINAGELVTCKAEEIASLNNPEFSLHTVTGLIAGVNDQDMALAFNDVVISTTVVGMVEGNLVDFDAGEFLAGNRVIAEPQRIGRESARVTKLTSSGPVSIAEGRQIGTVIVGFSHYPSFFGKAIIGGIILSSLTGAPAGCLVCEQPLVRTRLSLEELHSIEPINSAFASLAPGETILVENLDTPAVLCADGNPLACLQQDKRAYIRVAPEGVQVLHLAQDSQPTNGPERS